MLPLSSDSNSSKIGSFGASNFFGGADAQKISSQSSIADRYTSCVKSIVEIRSEVSSTESIEKATFAKQMHALAI